LFDADAIRPGRKSDEQTGKTDRLTFVIMTAACMPYADERNRAIMKASHAQGFAALVLMNLVSGTMRVANDGLPARLDAESLRYLLLQVDIAFAIASACRIARYRLG
jgi:hypothetical protein